MLHQPFAFRGVVASKKKPLEAFFLLLPHECLRVEELDVAITRLLQDGGISPDIIVCVFFSPNKNDVHTMLASWHIRERFERIQRCGSVLAAEISKDSSFDQVATILGDTQTRAHVTNQDLFDTYRTAGMQLLSARDGVVVRAAPGSYFLNPSGNKRLFFIRAGLLCKTSMEATYVASLLIEPLRAATRELGRTPNLFFLDTVGIAYLAYALADLALAMGLLQSRPEIRTFGSYDGYKNIGLSLGQYPFFIVSASTSGQLSSQLRSIVRAPNAAHLISTVLGSYKEEYPQLVYVLPETVTVSTPDVSSYFDTLAEIRVHGEDFLFAPGRPHAVILKRPHLPKNFTKQFKSLQGKNLIHYFKKANSRKQIKPFLLFDEAFVSLPSFQDWLRSQALSRVPLSVTRIVYQEDKASKLMAESFIAKLKEKWSGTLPALTSLTELEREQPRPDETVVVLAAVAGSGMELMRVCRELRSYQPNGARVFIVGALIARSNQQLQQVLANLRLSEKPNQYAVEVWCEFSPTRIPIEQMRERELSLWSSILDEENSCAPSLELRNIAAGRKDLLQDTGMPMTGQPLSFPFISLTPTSKAWELGKSFALWDPPFDNPNCTIDVLFTVACWLQNARESGELKIADRLNDGGFQQVVIAPDCFLRFTDPVIQASILRCGQDSEFNYSTSNEFSARAAEIIAKFIELREPATTEFLFALSEGRMRLVRSHLRHVLQVATPGANAVEVILIERATRRFLN